MTQCLVVVESPAKAKTIQKYLEKLGKTGKKSTTYKVLASYGHVRDLVPKEGAVDPAHGFAMKYEPIERNARYVGAISKALKASDILYLAMDPDREGEAIAWHVTQLLEEAHVVQDKIIERVIFHQITESAIQQAVSHPRKISMDLVNAQQARRALDYLVGFNLSPLLWRKIRPGLSAGRVQSPALRMIVEREEEIEKFQQQEYWTIHANLWEQEQGFDARLIRYRGEKLEQFSIIEEKQANDIRLELFQAADGFLQVVKVTKKERKRYPAPPFITSTLQQEAVRKLGFSAQKAMQIAQQLYEGIETDEGLVGLITYMRTDSVSLAAEAVEEIRDYIRQSYQPEQLPAKPRIYKSKSKNAQEAHEAIRPTQVFRTPESLKKFLNADQLKLYALIWRRTLASQMSEAILHTVAVDLAVNDSIFRANGSTVVSLGFMSVYQEDVDDKKRGEDEANRILPPMQEGQKIKLLDMKSEQHFTEPPPRYTEASLVKALEEKDIGRPSTYASIIATLKNRKYVTMESKRFYPTDVGRIVNRFLTNYFTQYVDYDFTARLEDELDEIARGDKAWVPVLEEFWAPFKERVQNTQENVSRREVTQETLAENCPRCGHPLSIRLGKKGRFIGCTAYPECDYTRSLTEESATSSSGTKPEIVPERTCPKCGSSLVMKQGRFGQFIGCSAYPKCHYLESLDKPKDTGVTCPECHQGTMTQRKSRYGKVFYSCSRYPDCQYAVWNEPIAEVCPLCRWPMLTIKTTKRRGTEKVCPQKNCEFKEKLNEK